MTFQQLRYLLEVYKTGSIAKAAANLFVTRPGVSLCINTLEAELGYPIFIRTPQGLQPTPQGEKALEYAARIFDNYRLMTAPEQPEHRRIRIATVNYEPVHNATYRLLKEYRDDPSVAFSFSSATVVSAPKRLSLCELDAALIAPFTRDARLSHGQLENKNLRWKVLGQIPMTICIGPGHRLYEKPELTPADFDGEVLLDTPGLAFSRISWIQDYVKFDPSRAISCDNYASELIAQGIGFSIRRSPTSRVLKCYNLRCIPLDGLTQELICITNPARPLLPEVQRFIDILDEELAGFQDTFTFQHNP